MSQSMDLDSKQWPGFWLQTKYLLRHSAPVKTKAWIGVTKVVPWYMVLWQGSVCGILRQMDMWNSESVATGSGETLQLEYIQFMCGWTICV